MAEFEVGGHTYRTGKLSAMKQIHVARKIAPLFAAVPGILSRLNEGVAALKPVLEEMASMSSDDLDFVVKECMLTAYRKDGSDWQRVWVEGSDSPMYEDIDGPQILQIVQRVVMENLGPFMRAVPQSSKDIPGL